MQHYRIFVFDRDNRFAGIELADFPRDDDALARAAKLVSDQHGAEVWQFARFVGRLAPEAAVRPPTSALKPRRSRKKQPSETMA